MATETRMTPRPRVAALVLAACAAAACGASVPGGGFVAGDGAAAAGPTGGEGPGSAGGPGGFQEEDGGAKVSPDAACAAVHESAVSTPVNLYVMLDRSSSLAGGKWDAAKAGLEAFVSDARSAGLRVALNFFPRPIDATPRCDQNAYRAPRVPFAALPANAPSVVAALHAETPNGTDTPIYPALGGALLAAIAEAQARPGERGVVLLVTDGEPAGPAPLCGGANPEDVAEIERLAASGLAFSPSVRTFVVGLPGVPPGTANRIAAAGGTTQAHLVGTSSVQQHLVEALQRVRGESLPCEYALPPRLADRTYAYDQVNVAVTPGGGGEVPVAHSPACAGGEGWRYDDRASPTRILLCPATCARLRTDFAAQLQILLGCATVIK